MVVGGEADGWREISVYSTPTMSVCGPSSRRSKVVSACIEALGGREPCELEGGTEVDGGGEEGGEGEEEEEEGGLEKRVCSSTRVVEGVCIERERVGFERSLPLWLGPSGGE